MKGWRGWLGKEWNSYFLIFQKGNPEFWGFPCIHKIKSVGILKLFLLFFTLFFYVLYLLRGWGDIAYLILLSTIIIYLMVCVNFHCNSIVETGPCFRIARKMPPKDLFRSTLQHQSLTPTQHSKKEVTKMFHTNSTFLQGWKLPRLRTWTENDGVCLYCLINPIHMFFLHYKNFNTRRNHIWAFLPYYLVNFL